MVHWTEMRKELRAAIGKFAGLQPDVMQGIDKMQNAAVVTGHLDAKTHELIALAVAVTTRCDGCLSVHAEAAAKFLGPLVQSLSYCRPHHRCPCSGACRQTEGVQGKCG